MRLWSLHPKYLDPQGLVALWREALLARAVLSGNTRGYRSHPQLERFSSHAAPLAAIDSYLHGVYTEATGRGYAFDRSKLGRARIRTRIVVTEGQLEHEWRHLLEKLSARSPELHRRWASQADWVCHPLFDIRPGPVAAWERIRSNPMPATRKLKPRRTPRPERKE
jgi:hypothetical protein